MLNGCAEMRIARDSQSLDQPDALLVGLGEIVPRARAHRDDNARHTLGESELIDRRALVHFAFAAAFKKLTVSGVWASAWRILVSTTVPDSALIGSVAFIAAARNSGSFMVAS